MSFDINPRNYLVPTVVEQTTVASARSISTAGC